MRWFADHRLGKGVVVAKDTPNFIANHIALYGVMRMIDVLAEGGYTVEEIDAITGPALGRPKSATFRTMDIAGLDVLALVVRNLYDRLPEGARDAFAVPPLLARLIEKGWVGEKAGQGFYKRVKNAAGESEILALDPATFEYRPRAAGEARRARRRQVDRRRARARADAVRRPRQGRRVPARARWRRRSSTRHASRRTSRTPSTTSTACCSGASAGSWARSSSSTRSAWPRSSRRGAQSAGADAQVPPLLADAIAAGRNRIRQGTVPPAGPDLQILRTAKERERVVKRNAGASLVDLGDGVLAVEFHSKMNAIGGDTIQMINAGVAEAERNFQALVVGNDAPNFSAGANLMLLLLEAQEGNWDEIDLMVRAFQGATSALRFAKVPVVVAPAGLTLGGGCEVALHGDRVQAAAETYIGLVEVGVGLIPAGGGTKEMLARAAEALGAAGRPAARQPARLRDDRVREGRDQRGRRAAHRLPARRGWHLDEPRAAAVGRQAEGAGTRARGLPAAGAAAGHPRRRRRRARRADAGRAPGVARRAHQRPRRAHRPQARAASSAAARCRTRRR